MINILYNCIDKINSGINEFKTFIENDLYGNNIEVNCSSTYFKMRYENDVILNYKIHHEFKRRIFLRREYLMEHKNKIHDISCSSFYFYAKYYFSDPNINDLIHSCINSDTDSALDSFLFYERLNSSTDDVIMNKLNNIRGICQIEL